MEKTGVLVVSYGSREVAMVDAFARSLDYDVELYVADKQRNPFNLKAATKHVVIPDLNIHEIAKFAKVNKDHIDFGIVGPEKPIIEGVRDLVEREAKIPMICPTKEYAIEESKVKQRLLFEEIMPEVNPRFKVFSPEDFGTTANLERAVHSWLDELHSPAVVKPDKPVAGKGVGVWGDHFTTRGQLFDHFLSSFQHGSVIIEEKIEGEESSFQALCDGKHLIPLPDTRDYKRAFDDDKGPNTGGMGSYKDTGDVLPFLNKHERGKEEEIADRIFNKWKSKSGTGLRGVPLYIAFMHTGKHLKILEDNSRPGDPEIINILPILKDDLVDICFKILESNLNKIELEKTATVVTYKVPSTYGSYSETHPDLVDETEIDTPVDLSRTYELGRKRKDCIRVYPGSMEQRGSGTYALRSRTVAVVGIGATIENARQLSLEGIETIKGGALWNRTDIASKKHIDDTKKHMETLRNRQ